MISNMRVVGNQTMRRPCRDPLIDPEPDANTRVPFWPPPFNPIHVCDDLAVLHPQIWKENGAVVAQDKANCGPRRGVTDTMPVKLQGGAWSGRRNLHVDFFNAAPKTTADAVLDALDFLLAIDANLPAPFNQKQR